jgi:hypothetical protein
VIIRLGIRAVSLPAGIFPWAGWPWNSRLKIRPKKSGPLWQYNAHPKGNLLFIFPLHMGIRATPSALSIYTQHIMTVHNPDLPSFQLLQCSKNWTFLRCRPIFNCVTLASRHLLQEDALLLRRYLPQMVLEKRILKTCQCA